MTLIKENVRTRKLYWIVDLCGNCGKSTFTDILTNEYNCLRLPLDGRRAFKYHSAKRIQDFLKERGTPPDAIIVDAPRDEEDNFLHASYGVLEEINNGRIEGQFSTSKVNSTIPSGTLTIVFSNSPPDVSKLSDDRWEIFAIRKINDGKDFYLQKVNVQPEGIKVRKNHIFWNYCVKFQTSENIDFPKIRRRSKSTAILKSMHKVFDLTEEKITGPVLSAPFISVPKSVLLEAEKRGLLTNDPHNYWYK